MRKSLGIVLLGIMIVLSWVYRPVYHSLVMGIYTHAGAWAIISAVTIITFLGSWYTYKLDKKKLIDAAVNAGIMFVIVLLIIGGSFAYFYNYGQYTNMYHTTDYVTINEMPAFDQKDVRAVPMTVADQLIQKSFVEARYKPDETFITEVNNTTTWITQLTPDGLIIQYTLEPKGVAYVPMDSMNITIVNADMHCGYGIGIRDNIYFILETHQYFADYSDPIPIIENGTVYYIVPFIKYHIHLYYSTPYWGGVAVINTKNCSVKFLSPEEAYGKYSNLPIYPIDLAKMKAEAMNYWKSTTRGNWMNLHVDHQNLIEVHAYDIGGNGQPFFVRLADGKGAWVIAAEPYGTGSGIKRIIIVTMNGTVEYLNFDRPITGVSAAMTAIKNALPTYDWTQFDIVEPLPVQVNGTMYWRFVIVPNGATTIKKIALVPMKSSAISPNDIKFFDTIDEYKAFITGEHVITPEKPTTETVNGTLEKKFTYTENGTTHFIIELSVNGTEKIYDIPVTCLSKEQIIYLYTAEVGQNITLTSNGECWVPEVKS